MSDSVANEPLPSKPYDDEYVFKVPYMRLDEYKDGEFEHDERLLLTALTGRYELKTDAFHRLLAKFILYLTNFSKASKKYVIQVLPFASEFRSTKELSNQIELSDLFDCDLDEVQLLEVLPLDSSPFESDLNEKSWLFAAISSLLIRSKIKNPKCQQRKYQNLCSTKLRAISGKECLFQLEKTPWKIAIDFNKFEMIMMEESDALRFAICWMVLVLENRQYSKAANLFNFCFLASAKHHGLELFKHWDHLTQFGDSDFDLEFERWSRIAKNIDAVGKSLENLTRFFNELPMEAVKDGKQDLSGTRWRYCRVVDEEYFSYMGTSANLKTCFAMVFTIDLMYSSVEKHFPRSVNFREKGFDYQNLVNQEEKCQRKWQEIFPEKQPDYQKLTDVEKKCLRDEHEIFEESSNRKQLIEISYLQEKLEKTLLYRRNM